MRPLWRDLILKIWGADPLQCPCCKAPMKLAGAVNRPEQVEFFLRLHGLWEGIIQLPRPPPPPFDIETMDPIEPPWLAVIKEWIPDDEPDLDWFNRPRNPADPDAESFDQSQGWAPAEIHLDDGRHSGSRIHLKIWRDPLQNRNQKKSWQSGPESFARDD